MLKHLLVALDETRDSRVALQHALDLARAQRGRLHLVTVDEDEAAEPEIAADARFTVELAGPLSGAPAPSGPDEDEAADEHTFQPQLRPVLDDAREICKQHGVSAGLSVLSGRPADRLTRKLRAADALVIGRGAGEPGSCARDLVRSARKPVLVTGHEYVEPDGVLAVYDGTEAGQRALQVAGELCTTGNRRLSVVCCGRGRDEQHRHQSEAEEYVAGYGLRLDARRVDADAVDEIVSAAGELAVSAVAVPRRQGLLERLRPTVAERVLGQFRGPVWVVS